MPSGTRILLLALGATAVLLTLRTLAFAQAGPPRLSPGFYLGNDKDGNEMDVSIVDAGKDLKIGRMTIRFRSDEKHPLVLGKDHLFGVARPDGLEFAVCPLESSMWRDLFSHCYLGHIQKTQPSLIGALLSKPANTIRVTLRKPTSVFTAYLGNSDGGLLSDDVAKNLKDEYEFVLAENKDPTKH